jgi:hypothetical protein
MFPVKMLSNFLIISMKDVDDKPEINTMISKSIQLLRDKNLDVVELIVDGNNLLKRIIRLICTAD